MFPHLWYVNGNSSHHWKKPLSYSTQIQILNNFILFDQSCYFASVEQAQFRPLSAARKESFHAFIMIWKKKITYLVLHHLHLFHMHQLNEVQHNDVFFSFYFTPYYLLGPSNRCRQRHGWRQWASGKCHSHNQTQSWQYRGHSIFHQPCSWEGHQSHPVRNEVKESNVSVFLFRHFII